MTATILSPNTGNYQVGKGVLSFKKTGAATYRDLGNAATVSLAMDRTKLDHFSSRAGLKQKDYSVTIETAVTCKITLDEVTPDNVGMMMLGTVDDASVGGPEVDIFLEANVTGALKFVGSNTIGATVTLDLWNVSFGPAGDFNLISDEWNSMDLEADVLAGDTAPNIGKFGLMKFTNVAPTT